MTSSTAPSSPRSAGRQAPGVTAPADFARTLLAVRHDPLAAFDRLAAEHGDAFRVSAPGIDDHLFLRDPELIREVLISDQDNYAKSSQYEILQRVLGMGLVTSEGQRWREHRSLVQPMFAKRALGEFAGHMAAAAAATLDRWESTWPEDHALDLSTEMSTLTLDIVGRALVGTDFSARSAEFGEALYDFVELAGEMGRSPITQVTGAIRSLGVSRGMRAQPLRMRRMNAAVDVLDDVVLEIIERRRAEGGQHSDLLGTLMGYTHPTTGEPLTHTELRDELMTFVTAGHETTANALSWTWAMLSKHPAARDQMLAEIDEVLGGATPTADDLDRLPWTTACLQEAMRLCPPIWMFERRAIADTTVGEYAVPAGTVISISPWLVHRNPQVWENPAGFDPRRFLGDAPKERPRLAFLPFAAGRRVCIGQGFAMMEGVLLLAMLSQRYTFDLVPGARVEPEPTVTLRPRGGVPVTAKRRG